MNRYPVEALLRPPVELWSVLVATLTALIAISAPWTLMMPPGVAWMAALLLLLMAAIRGHQAWVALRYQRHMRRLPRYTLTADRIPVSRHRLFLGRGFRWTQKHTQRLRDTLHPQVQKYLQPSALYRWARRMETAWENRTGLQQMTKWLGRDVFWNPVRPLPAVGGKPQLHAIEPSEVNVWMDLADRVGHTLVLGTTRVGKTRLAEVLITQDIQRGDCVIVFDPKGDGDLLRRVYAEARRAGREDTFYLFHLGHPDISARYNAIGNFSRITEVATRIASQLPSAGNSAAFKEFAWRFCNIIARALVALGRRPDYHAMRRHLNDIEPLFKEYARHYLTEQGPEDWVAEIEALAKSITERSMPSAQRGRDREAVALMRYMQRNELNDPVLDGLLSAFKYDRTYFDKIVSSVGPLMEKLTTGSVAELISPDYLDPNDRRPIFEWLEVIRQNGIVYVGLDALSDATVAGAVGNSMFADLVSVAGHIYKHGVHDETTESASERSPSVISLHADEFNELIGDEFVPLLNKAGGAGFQVTAYTQTGSDIEARIESRARTGQVIGNFNTTIMLRVKELATAELLTEQLPRVEINLLTQLSGVSDAATPGTGVHFTSSNQDRLTASEVPLITPAEIMALPKGQAFALLSGGQLWKLRLPLPDAGESYLPENLASIAGEMDSRYFSNEQWFRDNHDWMANARVSFSGQAEGTEPNGVEV